MRFVPGIDLCRDFYHEIVRPLLQHEQPHAAALLDGGSEVLGFDTSMSTDHDWGPRVQIFTQNSVPGLANQLEQQLPKMFHEVPVFFSSNVDGTASPDANAGNFARLEVTTWAKFSKDYLGVDADAELTPLTWLKLPQQKLLTVSSGPIFHDAIGITSSREKYSWYPNDVWLYILACTWRRIGQEEHLVGRAGFLGDELGAKLIAARLVRDMMRLAFLLERSYAPYAKWFGSAFAKLSAAPALTPLLEQVLAAKGWEERDAALAQTFEAIAKLQNSYKLTPPKPDKTAQFHSRPFSAIELHADFQGALLNVITDPKVIALKEATLAGSIDLISDNTDVLESDDLEAVLTPFLDSDEPNNRN